MIRINKRNLQKNIKKFFIGILISISSFSILPKNLFAEEFNKANSVKSKTTSNFEFKFSKQEMKDIGKWKKKNADNLLEDSFLGDPGALYLLGYSNLAGQMGFTINIRSADQHFAASATQGFAPATYQIMHKYLEENNFFMSSVYLNLLASQGHNEYIMVYHNFRDHLLDRCGSKANKILERIEHISAQKQLKINKTKESLKTIKNKDEKMKFIMKQIHLNEGITQDDENYNVAYWEQLYLK